MKARSSNSSGQNGKNNSFKNATSFSPSHETRFLFLGTKVLDELKILAHLASALKEQENDT